MSVFILCAGWKRGKVCEGTSKPMTSARQAFGECLSPTLDEGVRRFSAAERPRFLCLTIEFRIFLVVLIFSIRYYVDMEEIKANQDKNLEIEVDGQKYLRLPLKTHVITGGEKIVDVAEKYAGPYKQEGDMFFISERVVAISQGRAFPIKDIKPSALANFLVRFVHKSPYGIGLGSPWTMELAVREAGATRILFAAFLSAITKPFGLKGVFYHAVGKNINAIDGPCDYTLPPYNHYAKLGPANPDKVAREIKHRLGCEVVIIDANDLGVNILGRSDKSIDSHFCEKLFRDNPLGQSSEQTPMALIRKI